MTARVAESCHLKARYLACGSCKWAESAATCSVVLFGWFDLFFIASKMWNQSYLEIGYVTCMIDCWFQDVSNMLLFVSHARRWSNRSWESSFSSSESATPSPGPRQNRIQWEGKIRSLATADVSKMTWMTWGQTQKSIHFFWFWEGKHIHAPKTYLIFN
jgi:hypothetical protein